MLKLKIGVYFHGQQEYSYFKDCCAHAVVIKLANLTALAKTINFHVQSTAHAKPVKAAIMCTCIFLMTKLKNQTPWYSQVNKWTCVLNSPIDKLDVSLDQ